MEGNSHLGAGAPAAPCGGACGARRLRRRPGASGADKRREASHRGGGKDKAPHEKLLHARERLREDEGNLW